MVVKGDLSEDPSGIHPRHTNAEMSFELGTSLEDEADLDIFTVQVVEHLHQIDKNILDSQKGRAEIMEELSSMQLPESPPDFEKRLDRFELSSALTTVMSYIALELYSEAEREVKRALRIATSLDEETSIARCYYWMGRIELEKRSLPTAYRFFMNARPCFMDEDCVEGQSLDYYLKLSRPGGPQRHRSTRLSNYPDETSEDNSKENHSKYPSNSLSNKRKWDTQQWDLVLRPATSARPTTQNSTTQSVAWMVKNTEDVLHRNSPWVRKLNEGVSPDNAQWLNPTDPGTHSVKRQPFTFRCYPRGLAPRSRQTKIFSEQPEEHLLSAESWAILQERTKDKKVTMAYLAAERRKHKTNW